jgi:hypothetical protein
VLAEPLTPIEVKRLVGAILDEGAVTFSKHALMEMDKDGLTTVDVVNMLRGGVVEQGELENGSWRYRVRTARMCVVLAFRSKSELRIVTAWRFR